MAEGFTQAAGSILGAAMETAGARYQTEFLDLLNSQSGQTLAGFLFTLAIAAAVLMFAIGGEYKWGRYLLVGPALFFFLTRVTVASEDTTWKYADDVFPQNLVEEALQDVGNGKGGEVSYFFKFWNTFMSDLTQQLIKLTNVTENDSHLNFIQKVDRYMTLWNEENIKDEHLHRLVRTVMRPQCSEYFSLKKAMADPHIDQLQKTRIEKELDKRWTNNIVFYVVEEDLGDGSDDVKQYLASKGKLGGFTCQALWETVVNLEKDDIKAQVDKLSKESLGPNQESSEILKLLLKKVGTATTRTTNELQIAKNEVEGVAWMQAVDWVIARSLFKIMSDSNPFAESYGFESHLALFQAGPAGVDSSGQQEEQTAENIRQFAHPEKYQKKAEFVNAALALPHFQGLGLFLLASAYPFFALLVVLPGRASTILTWMGLWAWLKLWDFGFAVVMMIDNMLFALFPRGPMLAPGDINDAGKAWVRIMEIDPNYAAATYYNLIATCMFAVPVFTGLLVKKGGGELINAMHGGFTSYSQRLSDSAGVYARALQARGYANIMEQMKYQRVAIAQWIGFMKSMGFTSQFISNMINQALSGKAAEMIPGGKYLNEPVQAALKSLGEQAKNMTTAGIKLETEKALYDLTTGRQGQWLSESAVAARYATHSFATPFPSGSLMNAYLASQTLDQKEIGKAAIDGMLNSVDKEGNSLIKSAFAPGGASE